MKKLVRSFSLPVTVVEILEEITPKRKMSDYIADLVIKDRAEMIINKNMHKMTLLDLVDEGDKIKTNKLKNPQDILDLIEKGRK